MRFGFVPLLLAFCLVASSAQASNLNTTSSLEDEGIEPSTPPATILDGIPLMKGLQLESDPTFVKILPDFAGAQPVTTVGIVDVDDAYNFYKRTLPPLGWNATSGRDYAKGAESLHINAHADGKMTTVTFTEETSGQ
jgi:hypothetical protein